MSPTKRVSGYAECSPRSPAQPESDASLSPKRPPRNTVPLGFARILASRAFLALLAIGFAVQRRTRIPGTVRQALVLRLLAHPAGRSRVPVAMVLAGKVAERFPIRRDRTRRTCASNWKRLPRGCARTPSCSPLRGRCPPSRERRWPATTMGCSRRRPRTANRGAPPTPALGWRRAADGTRAFLPGAQCHGSGGSGVGESFPPFAGQPASSIAEQLKAWQGGARAAWLDGGGRTQAERQRHPGRE